MNDLFITGYREPTPEFEKMKAIYLHCQDLKIDPPDAVQKYFPSEPGDGPNVDLYKHESVTEWSTDYAEGYEVDLSKLPKGTTKLRFYHRP